MLGYGLDYDNDIDNNNPIVPNAFYTFISEKGFKESDKAGLSGEHIISIKNRNLEEVPRKSLKEITTKAIRFCLDGKELSSREIFKSIKK